MIWTQIFGLTSVIIGIYISAELESGSGATIALVAATIFTIVASFQIVINPSSHS
jgi:ABC-type Mn2+/Zn2+ transport system permease subunit